MGTGLEARGAKPTDAMGVNVNEYGRDRQRDTLVIIFFVIVCLLGLSYHGCEEYEEPRDVVPTSGAMDSLEAVGGGVL